MIGWRIDPTTRSRLRDLARRLPVLGAYQRRIDALTSELGRSVASRYVAPGHFYSPFPSRDDLRKRRAEIFEQDALDIAGVDLRVDDQLVLLKGLLEFLPSVPFDDDADDAHRYGYDNPTFSYGDGTFLFLMLSWLRPRRLIEVGSGHSSACALDTIDQIGGNNFNLR